MRADLKVLRIELFWHMHCSSSVVEFEKQQRNWSDGAAIGSPRAREGLTGGLFDENGPIPVTTLQTMKGDCE
jgi:hypothetical protein